MRRFQALLMAAGLAAAPASAAAGTNSNSKTAPPASEVSHDKGRPVGKDQAVCNRSTARQEAHHGRGHPER